MGTFRDGIAYVVLFISLVFIAITVLDILCDAKGWPSIGYRVQGWSRRNPGFKFGLLLALAMLMAHFLLNAIHYPP